ncbi:MAG TPA: alpha-D-glucose phosphate-specific phosphoglucomutase [Gammaproteobacteria bacterium]|nr:alpha-D-glucose phosphate-specific phosphoglucomutase [Gammaproteobacteria bacterium]
MSFPAVNTRPFDDQRPGTAGLRRPVSRFREAHYLENFIQSVFDTFPTLAGHTLVIGGDGRFFNREAIGVLLRMAAANGVQKAVVGQDGLLSTPAASLLIPAVGAAGGFILTASHNLGGPEGDFGIKFNIGNGGQASESQTDAIYQRTLSIDSYKILPTGPGIDLHAPGMQKLGSMQVEIVDPVRHYAEVMQRCFDFERMRALLASGKFRLRFDAMHAVTGPYALEVFERLLGAPAGSVMHGKPLADFGGGHPDPNPHDAADFVAGFMCAGAPDFGAASDGDGDRNMILGPGVVVSPGDSLAVLAANARLIPGYKDGLAGLARSMPTSRAADRVAAKLGIPCYETPTGWRFFCNLLDAGRVTLCGEESFGTSSNHAREKDGLWAVLFWLNLLAVRQEPLPVILRKHWAEYGRDFFLREDYDIPDAGKAAAVMHALEASLAGLAGKSVAGVAVASAESFTYTDPVDGSVSRNQGIRISSIDGGRMVFRLSGTGTRGATLRVYLEHHEADVARQDMDATAALTALSSAARSITRLEELTGIATPSMVT